MRTAAGALARNEARKVARAIANERGALARERGNDELAEFAVGHRLEGVGVHDSARNWSSHRCKPFASEHSMATPGPMISERPYTSQYCTPSLRRISSRVASLQGSAPRMTPVSLNLVHAHAHFRNGIGDEQRIRRRRTQNGDTEIFHDLDLALGVARGHGNDHGACGFGAEMRAQPPVNKP